MTEPLKTNTHTAFIFKREGKRRQFGRWLECGVARLEKDGAINVYLDRTPVGGFSGHIFLAKLGSAPPVPEPQPQRPGDGDEGDEVDSEG